MITTTNQTATIPSEAQAVSGKRPRRLIGPFSINRKNFDSFPMKRHHFKWQERYDLNLAMKTGYLIDHTSTQRRRGIATLYKVWCRNMKVPYICFQPRKTRASVEIDLQPSGLMLKPPDAGEVWALLRDFSIPDRSDCFFRNQQHGKAYSIRIGNIDRLGQLLVDYAKCAQPRDIFYQDDEGFFWVDEDKFDKLLGNINQRLIC